MPSTVEDLVRLLQLERVDDDIFRGYTPKTLLQRVFGGQVLGQALMAAGLTVDPARQVHSLHAYFLRLGDPNATIAYVVERVREGRSFSTRRVVARQHGRPIFQMSASFHLGEPGVDHADVMPPAPDPETLPTIAELVSADPGQWQLLASEWDAIEVRPILPPGVTVEELAGSDQVGAARLRVWLRAAGELPDVPLVHAAVLAYASDMTLLGSAVVPHGIRLGDPRLFTASLDHAMWFHRSFRADEWLLHDQWSPSASGGRGLGMGKIFDATGKLVASTVQEGLIRLNDPDAFGL